METKRDPIGWGDVQAYFKNLLPRKSDFSGVGEALGEGGVIGGAAEAAREYYKALGRIAVRPFAYAAPLFFGPSARPDAPIGVPQTLPQPTVLSQATRESIRRATEQFLDGGMAGQANIPAPGSELTAAGAALMKPKTGQNILAEDAARAITQDPTATEQEKAHAWAQLGITSGGREVTPRQLFPKDQAEAYLRSMPPAMEGKELLENERKYQASRSLLTQSSAGQAITPEQAINLQYQERVKALGRAGMTKEKREKAMSNLNAQRRNAIDRAQEIASQNRSELREDRRLDIEDRKLDVLEKDVQARRYESRASVRKAEIAAQATDQQAKWKAMSEYHQGKYKTDVDYRKHADDIRAKAREFNLNQEQAKRTARVNAYMWAFGELTGAGKDATKTAIDLLGEWSRADDSTKETLKESGVLDRIQQTLDRASGVGMSEDAANMLNSVFRELK